MTKKSVKLGIFDIDGTLFRSSLLIEVTNGLFAAGIFPKEARNDLEKEYGAWLNRKGHYDEYLQKVVTLHGTWSAGVHVEAMRAITKAVMREHKDRVYRFTRGLITRLKEQNYFLLTVSGSPDYIVQEFARHFGFDRAFGTIYEVKRGRFTGAIEKMNTVTDKPRVVRAFLKEASMRADFKKSIAVGDTDSDSALLEMVGFPIAFNPNRRLADYARKKKWPIVVERKDVIYRVHGFDRLEEASAFPL